MRRITPISLLVPTSNPPSARQNVVCKDYVLECKLVLEAAVELIGVFE